MIDIALSEAILLWNSGIDGDAAFAVRPLGHEDYWHYTYQSGACWYGWRSASEAKRLDFLKAELLKIVARYDVPWSMIDEGMSVVPEYRAFLEALA